MQVLCRFSDAGMTGLSTRRGSRRPKTCTFPDARPGLAERPHLQHRTSRSRSSFLHRDFQGKAPPLHLKPAAPRHSTPAILAKRNTPFYPNEFSGLHWGFPRCPSWPDLFRSSAPCFVRQKDVGGCDKHGHDDDHDVDGSRPSWFAINGRQSFPRTRAGQRRNQCRPKS